MFYIIRGKEEYKVKSALDALQIYREIREENPTLYTQDKFGKRVCEILFNELLSDSREEAWWLCNGLDIKYLFIMKYDKEHKE